MNVVVRIRPGTESESCVTCPGDNVITVRKEGENSDKCAALDFKFSEVFPPTTETEKLYDDVLHPIVDNVLKGTPGCLFAYGQTGSGKTHTITGTAIQPGLLPMAVGEMLERTAADEEVVTSCVYLTYLEIYNEVIKDLLNPDGPTLSLREDANGRPHLPNMTRTPVASVEDALAIVHEGEKVRAKSANSVHEHSSRSHAIFTITVETRRASEAAVRIGLLHIIDLAGSETIVPANQTHIQDADMAVEARKALHDMGNRHIVERETKKVTTKNREGSHIRRSLLALIRCVQKMADRAPFIPYRDSNLTRLLRAPLEGNSNTAIVCTVNPCEGKETIATLRFAATAQRCHRTPASKVVSLSTEGSLLKSYERELAQLKEEMTRNMEEERRRAEELKLSNQSNLTELQKAEADRLALQAKLDAINSKLLKTQKKAEGPPTPRTALKIVAFENGRGKRSGSAPNRRGAIFADAKEEAVGQPIPKWLRDAALRSQRQHITELEERLGAAEAASVMMANAHAEATAAQDSRIAELEAEILLLRKAGKAADEERGTMASYLDRQAALANQKKKKKGLGCGSKKAVQVREDAPAMRKFDDIVAALKASLQQS